MKSIIRDLLLFTCICFLVSCASVHPTNFYTLTKPLTPLVNNEQTSTVKQANRVSLSVNVPDGLKRPQIVINNKNDSHLFLLEHHRWLSAFDEELSDALSSGIHSNTDIQALSTNDRYHISVQLLQMDTVLADTVAAHFHWQIKHHSALEKITSPSVLVCEFSTSKSINNSVENAVHAMQDIVQDLIKIISQQIVKMETGQVNNCN